MDFEKGEIYLSDEKTSHKQTIVTDTVIATDGAAFAVRMNMLAQERFNFSQIYLKHGYKELMIPSAGDGGFRIEKNALHIWPRNSFMMIALPNINRFPMK